MRSQADILRETGAVIQVENADDLAREADALLNDDHRRGLLGEQARILVEGQKGASRELAEIILQDMDCRNATRAQDTR